MVSKVCNSYIASVVSGFRICIRRENMCGDAVRGGDKPYEDDIGVCKAKIIFLFCLMISYIVLL